MTNTTPPTVARRKVFSVAPMMDWTDRWCRLFHRALTKEALLYTEMVTTGAVIHGKRERLLGFDAAEQPVALQLGGSEPDELARAAMIGADFGYSEINLNCGCPSDRVQSGCFGAVLMKSPVLVGECVAAMKAVVDIPVTVKCRIGVDDQDPEEALDALADAVFAAGADALIVHARKAWLQGLSPKENRDIPPLDYARVRRLKARFSHKVVAINGGIADLDAGMALLDGLDGIMLGRAAYQNPGLLLDVDRRVYGKTNPANDMFAALDAFLPVIDRHVSQGLRLHAFTRHMVGLFPGLPGARRFRQHLATVCVKESAGVKDLEAAIDLVRYAAPVERNAA
jgi:tRNA-dihydrouridine synthase A